MFVPAVLAAATLTLTGWLAAGSSAGLAGQPVTVARLTRAGPGITALLTAGSGPGTSLLAAWSADGGTLTVWQHVPGNVTWTTIQVLNVPIPYGSSS